jgi:hypothetical protein
MLMGLGTWNMRKLYRSGSLKTVTREVEKCEYRKVGGNGVAVNEHATVSCLQNRKLEVI